MLIIIDSPVAVLVPQRFIRLGHGGFVVGRFFGACFVVFFLFFPLLQLLNKIAAQSP